MERARRLAKLALALLGFLLYVWIAAVHYADEVKRNKAARRARRLGRAR